MLRSTRRLALSFTLLVALAATARAQVEVQLDATALRRALEAGASELPEVEARWRTSLAPREGDEQSWVELFGYDPPGRALQLAFLHSFLFEREGRAGDARAAADYLLRMARYRDEVPGELRAARVEYENGLPAAPSFFHLADYADAWRRVRGHPSIDAELRAEVDAALAGSAEFVFVFPEWGAHNRAVLRAAGLAACADALPGHPRAERWRRMAEILAADSLGRWEIEDAQIYHPIWLFALARYGGEDVFRSLPGRYYLRYFLELLSPRGTVPAFGDAWEDASLSWYLLCLAWGAAVLQDPELAWAAREVERAMGPLDPERPGLGRALLAARLAGRADPELAPCAPELRSGPVLDDVIGKKLVLRRGGARDGLYLLANFRDEGDWGRLARDYLRHTLAVEEEKAHHGHGDEGSIVLLMDRGSVLLHDAGYRERAPSGPFGAYRAELFHNRLVVRPGAPAEGQSALEFLRDAGAYRPVRAELIDFARFEALDRTDYGRTRVTDAEAGWTWDRTFVLPHELPLVVVVDMVRLSRPGPHTLATLWATQRVVDAGPGWALGRYESLEGRALPDERDLLLVFPDATESVPEHFALRRHRQEERVLHELRGAVGGDAGFAAFVTVLWSVPRGADARELARRVRRVPFEPAGRGVALSIAGADGAPEIELAVLADLELGLVAENVRPRYDPARGTWRAGGLRSDADLVVVRRAGGEARWAATNMTLVELDGRTAFEAAPLQLFQVSGRSDVVGRTKWRRWEDVLRAPR